MRSKRINPTEAAVVFDDALDIIETKCSVTVVTVGDVETRNVNRVDGKVRHLETHGVAPVVKIVPESGKSIAQVLAGHRRGGERQAAGDGCI